MGFWQALLSGLNSKAVEGEEPQVRERLRGPRSNLVAGPRDSLLELPSVALPSTYRVELVGGQNYQSAIGSLCVGEPVKLLSEPDNPRDKRAIVAVTFLGRRLGYVPRSHPLYFALNFEGRGAIAKVMSVGRGQDGFHNVVLEIAANGDRIPQRRFTR
ncbi:HIRAN domain-containing protein [Novosphingobium sp. SL115]|uniref:HIRAN domain-containing protein n=1 Tax=Novosphingobium sp. SL115 TaxID=2995150 RepID=UPI002DD4479C|nr:HIRAN domain-containing protein [Novosphingobium sp. SL115]